MESTAFATSSAGQGITFTEGEGGGGRDENAAPSGDFRDAAVDLVVVIASRAVIEPCHTLFRQSAAVDRLCWERRAEKDLAARGTARMLVGL
jgi:hypothetical protein